MIATVDTGGTKTLVSGFYHDGTQVENSIKFPTPKDTKEYIAQLTEALHELFGNEEVEALVVALPGIIRDGIAIHCPNLGWEKFPAQEALSSIFGEKVPVLTENDANLAGLAEVRLLDPMPALALYITVSTGIGTGVISNGQIDPGLQHSEGGHMLVDFQGELREWESFASGRAIYKQYERYGRDISDLNTWDEIADKISRGFFSIIPMIQPDVVIVGGSMGEFFAHYGPKLQAILDEKLPDYIIRPEFKKAQHPDQAVVYGCYCYALDYLANH